MSQTLLTCPMCKRVNEPGTRFCRGCGRLLVEPNIEISATEHAPHYDVKPSLPSIPLDTLLAPSPTPASASTPATVVPVTSSPPTIPREAEPDATNARLIIRELPPEGELDAADAGNRVGEYALGGRTITIGRVKGCDIVFDGDTLTSRKHATLRFNDKQYTLLDLGSSNGTFVNDLEISGPTRLRHGDRILIGEHELLFLVDEPREITAPAPQPAADAIASATPTALALPDLGAQADTNQMASVQPHPSPAPAGATEKYASVARLSSEVAASASRMTAPLENNVELAAIRARLTEATEALTQQAALQSALSERRRALLVNIRERVADLLADLKGDDAEANSPVHHHQHVGLLELVEGVATDPNNLDRVRRLAARADDLAQALRSKGPTEDRWMSERDHAIRSLEDILYRLREPS